MMLMRLHMVVIYMHTQQVPVNENDLDEFRTVRIVRDIMSLKSAEFFQNLTEEMAY